MSFEHELENDASLFSSATASAPTRSRASRGRVRERFDTFGGVTLAVRVRHIHFGRCRRSPPPRAADHMMHATSATRPPAGTDARRRLFRGVGVLIATALPWTALALLARAILPAR